jgi:hypothetical protein
MHVPRQASLLTPPPPLRPFYIDVMNLARSSSLLVAASFVLASCTSYGATGQAGFAYMKVGGGLALDSGTGGSVASIEQDIDSAFGLGDAQGSPYLRGQIDAGVPVLTASVFWLKESGQGQLDDPFGGLVTGTTVDTQLDLTVAKIAATFDFDLWLLKLSPGILFDVFAIDFDARESVLGSSEDIDEMVFVPMPFLRAEAGFGPVNATAEIGYIDVSGLDNSGGRFLDFEAMIEFYPLPLGHLFTGYRYIGIDANGDSGTESFATDLQIQGWVLGGGLRF